MFKRRLNNEASQNNSFKATESGSGCCGSVVSFCKYKFKAAGNDFLGFTALDNEGNPVTFTAPTPLSVDSEIALFISNSLESIGLLNVADEYMGVIVKDPDHSVEIVSENAIVSVDYVGGQVLAKVLCKKAAKCKYTKFVEYGKDFGKVSATSLVGGTQVGTPSGWAAGDPATVQADVETALTTEGIAFANVLVTENTVYGGYDVAIFKVGSGALFIGGAEVQNCGCVQDFTV